MIKKILVVDEDPKERKIINHTLSISGYNIIEAESSSSALLAISNHPDVDMIMIDWSIEEPDQNSTFSILSENFTTIPIFIMGNDDSNETITRVLSMGAVDYIIKPINKELLSFKVDNILNKDRQSLVNKSATRKQVLFAATCNITLTSISKQSITFNADFNIPVDTITTFTCEDLTEKLDIPFKTKFSFKITSCELVSSKETPMPYYKIHADFLNLSPMLATKIQDAINKNKFTPDENNKGYI